MDIIESYIPINSKEKVDQLISELSKHAGAMNPATRTAVKNAIQKYKIQVYFNEKYPIALFKDAPSRIKIQSSKQKEATFEATSSKDTVRSIVLPSATLGSKKHIVGTYMEMAFHNFFINLEQIYAMVFGRKIMDEARINYLNDNPDKKYWDGDFGNEKYVWNPMFSRMKKCLPEERLKVEELVRRKFPLLEVALDFTKNSRDFRDVDQIEILKRLSKHLRILRHYYSHYKIVLMDNQITTFEMNEPLVAGILEHTFIAAKRVVKSRFALDDTAMKCTEQYKFRTDYTKKDKFGKPAKIKEEIKGYKYKLVLDNASHLSEFGLVMLCSLFIEKKYSKILTDKLHCIPQADQSVMNELISVYRIRSYTEKFHVDKNTDALALDILTELRRCPKELFEIISPENQQKFRVTENEDGNDVLMVRQQDHFTNLVLKYIDKAKLFDSIRFQVSLGNYFYKFYDKYCIDDSNISRVRSLSKHVNGFGRLDEIDDAREEIWDTAIRKFDDIHKNTSEEQQYVTDHHPRYVVNSNRIAMRIFEESPQMFLPELTTQGVNNLPPTCWMSIYELPAMAFLIHLKGGDFVEDIIKSTVANYNKFFTDIAEGKLLPMENEVRLANVLDTEYGHIQLADIPDEMKNFLVGNDVDTETILKEQTVKLIDTLIEQTKYKIEKFKKDRKDISDPTRNKIGKKNYVSIKPGKLASFMAKDIMFFQPNDADNKNKLTGLNFRILQSVLALHNDVDVLKRTLIAAHIIGEKNDNMCNPVMMRIWNRRVIPANTSDLYQAYLEERLQYLQQCKKMNVKELPFVHPDRKCWQEHDVDYYKAKASRYLSYTVNGGEYGNALELPRGMFERYIREELSRMDGMKSMASDATKNISYLIYGYYKNIMLDDCQPMYEYARTYTLLNKLYRKSPKDDKVYYTPQQLRESLMRNSNMSIRDSIRKYIDSQTLSTRKEESDSTARMLKQVKTTETLLKRYKTQDMVLLLIAKKLLMTEEHDRNRIIAVEKILLKDIVDGTMLRQKIGFSVRLNTKNGCSKTIKQDDLKLKDYAKFYRILSDRRLPSLLDLVKTNVIDKTMIEQELDGYDCVHPDILETVFKYEKENMKEENCENFSNMISHDDNLSFEEKKLLTKTRNSFAHNTYPGYRDITDEARNNDLPEKATTISKNFHNIIIK